MVKVFNSNRSECGLCVCEHLCVAVTQLQKPPETRTFMHLRYWAVEKTQLHRVFV